METQGVNMVELEGLLRRVVREELGMLAAVPLESSAGFRVEAGCFDENEFARFAAPGAFVPVSVGEVSFPGRHPFDLTEAEVKAAEAILEEHSGKALRHRVTGYRLEKAGHMRHAKKHYAKADSLERQAKARQALR